jgi:hypothetical protein
MYLDSCIIVKLLVVEAESQLFVRALEGKPIVTSELSQTEVFSPANAPGKSLSPTAVARGMSLKHELTRAKSKLNR